jgi:hypothetical protein
MILVSKIVFCLIVVVSLIAFTEWKHSYPIHSYSNLHPNKATETFVQFNDDVLMIQVQDGIPIIIKNKGGFQSRHTSLIALINKLYNDYKQFHPPQQGIFLYASNDSPALINDTGIPYLSQSANTAAPNAIACLDHTFHHWPEAKMPSFREHYHACARTSHNAFKTKTDKLFWIGALTHPDRMQLMSLQHSNLMYDFRTINWEDQDPSSFVSIEEHGKNKYLLDIRGNGYSGRLKYLLLLGSVVFIVDRPDIEYWHSHFDPWVHYVPVKANLSDLQDNLQHVHSNQAFAWQIAEAGKTRALEIFSEERVMMDFANTLNMCLQMA